MSDIAEDIDGIIIHQLKLHQTTTKDLVNHVTDKLILKYPEANFTIPGITSRLESLQEEIQIEQTILYNRAVWKLCGGNITTPNRVWSIISSLAKLECHVKNIIYTIRKQNDSITSSEIKNAIGILQSNNIIQVNGKIASVTTPEKQFIIQDVKS